MTPSELQKNKFAALTAGCCATRWAEAKWSELSGLDSDYPLLTVPAARYKVGQTHEVPLTPLAVELLRSLPRFAGSDWIFTINETHPISAFTRPKSKLDKAWRHALAFVFGYAVMRVEYVLKASYPRPYRRAGESQMPIYVEISPLHRLVTIVARGMLTSDEVRGTAQKLAEARVRRFAKIVEVAGAHLDLAPADIAQLAQTLRGDPDSRGPIAFVVPSNRGTFARQFAAATDHEGPVDVFHSLHEARAWIARIQQRDAQAAMNRPPTETVKPGLDLRVDPDRQGTMIRGARQREFTTRELVS